MKATAATLSLPLPLLPLLPTPRPLGQPPLLPPPPPPPSLPRLLLLLPSLQVHLCSGGCGPGAVRPTKVEYIDARAALALTACEFGSYLRVTFTSAAFVDEG